MLHDVRTLVLEPLRHSRLRGNDGLCSPGWASCAIGLEAQWPLLWACNPQRQRGTHRETQYFPPSLTLRVSAIGLEARLEESGARMLPSTG